MKQHAQQQHKPAAQSREHKGAQKQDAQKKDTKKQDTKQERGAAKERAESDHAERTAMQYGTERSTKRPMPVPAEDGRAAAHEGQLPQNQQRLGQHQNSRKQP